MRGVQDFLKDSVPAMIDYLASVSSPIGDTPLSNLAYDAIRLDRLDVVHALRQRSQRMTVLDKESIPILPHLLDIPKHLAIVTSEIIRSSKNYRSRPKAKDDITDLVVEEFRFVCFEVEEEALRRVSQLATKLAEGRRPSILEVPSTTPSPSEPNSPIRQMSFGDSSACLQSCTQITSDDPAPWGQRGDRDMHMKAPSTDSIPSYRARDFPLSISPSCVSEPPIDMDPGKRKKGLLRGILRR
jgi:hypothetical protein